MRRAARMATRQERGSIEIPESARSYSSSALCSSFCTTLPSAGENVGFAFSSSGVSPSSASKSAGR
eukprot:212437-Rhodomonas_salina.2